MRVKQAPSPTTPKTAHTLSLQQGEWTASIQGRLLTVSMGDYSFSAMGPKNLTLLSLSPDGQLAAAASKAGQICIVNIQERSSTRREHPTAIEKLTITNDGQLIINQGNR